jgi:hypothetical protein
MMFRFPFLFLFGLLGMFVALAIMAVNLTPSTSVTATAAAPIVVTRSPRYEIRLQSERDGSFFHIDVTGSCLVTDHNGAGASSSSERTIEGTTPQSFTFAGESISCTIQKRHSESFPLMATVLRDGQVVKTLETNVTYGAVSFAI